MSSSRDVHNNLSFHSYSHMLIIMIIILLYKDVRNITRVKCFFMEESSFVFCPFNFLHVGVVGLLELGKIMRK